MIIELMGHQNVGKEIQFSFFGEVQMSRIAHKFDLSHHKLASLHFNILFKNSIYLIFCVANLPDTRHVYLSMKKCYLSIC